MEWCNTADHNVVGPFDSFWLLKSLFETTKEVISWILLAFDTRYYDYHDITLDFVNMISDPVDVHMPSYTTNALKYKIKLLWFEYLH